MQTKMSKGRPVPEFVKYLNVNMIVDAGNF